MLMTCSWAVPCGRPSHYRFVSNTSCYILHFSENDIVNSVIKWEVLLGYNGEEVAKSVNDFLDIEADKAMEMLRNSAALKPKDGNDINDLGIRALGSLCEDLVPTSVLVEEDEMVSEGYSTLLQLEVGAQACLGHLDQEVM